MSGLVCGFDLWADGRAVPVPEAAGPSGDAPFAKPGDKPADGAAWRWLHFEAANVQEWADEHLPHIAAKTLHQAETRPRCEPFADGVAINLRGVNFNEGDRAEDMISLRIWASAGLIVTARHRKVMAVDAVRKACEAGHGPATPGQFLALVIEGLVDRAEQFAAGLEDTATTLEEASLDGAPPASDIITLNRRAVIMLLRFAPPQRDALNRLAVLEGALFGKSERLRIREAAHRATRLAETLESLRDRLAVLQDHLDARADQQRGRTSYLLSVVAAIFLPLGFVTGLFGVNVAGMPGLETPAAFWLLSGGMAAIGAALVLAFRWLRWF